MVVVPVVEEGLELIGGQLTDALRREQGSVARVDLVASSHHVAVLVLVAGRDQLLAQHAECGLVLGLPYHVGPRSP